MSTNGDIRERRPPRILLFSQRNIYEPRVWRGAFHEFEELVQQIDSVDLLAPEPRGWYKNGKRLSMRLGRRFRSPLNPGVTVTRLAKNYDMFFAVCERPSELLNLTSLKGWDRCKTSFCLLPEFYVKDMPELKSCLEVLKRFDHVLFMFNTNEPFQRVIQGRGRFLPSGIDSLQFCPFPEPPARSIDVFSIGRRSPRTHEALLRMARQDGIFYVHDTIDSLCPFNLQEHRFLLANMAKRARYFIVNPGKIDRPDETGGQSEFGYRYFEGAAPGTIMIGERPKNPEFDKIFHWSDAVIHLPFGSDEIADVIKDLDRQPERQMRIRQKNMVECLLHHDWVYRWETILEQAGMAAMPELEQRKQRLRELAALVEEREREVVHRA
jgi:Glycosyl transferases group 1